MQAWEAIDIVKLTFNDLCVSSFNQLCALTVPLHAVEGNVNVVRFRRNATNNLL